MKLTRRKKEIELLLGWYTWFMKERLKRLIITSNGITSNFLATFVLLPEPTENALLLQVLYRSRPCCYWQLINSCNASYLLLPSILISMCSTAYRLLSHVDCYIMDCNYTSPHFSLSELSQTWSLQIKCLPLTQTKCKDRKLTQEWWGRLLSPDHMTKKR